MKLLWFEGSEALPAGDIVRQTINANAKERADTGLQLMDLKLTLYIVRAPALI